MRILVNKGYLAAALLSCLPLVATPVLANTEVWAPATEHQAETLKKLPDEGEEAFTSSKKKAAGTTEELNDDKYFPATVHQEETMVRNQKQS